MGKGGAREHREISRLRGGERCGPCDENMSWCEKCEAEREGTVCPVCGGPLLQEITPEELEKAHPEWGGAEGSLLDRWPKGPDGEPEEPAVLTRTADFESYRGILESKLAAAGIPVAYRYPEGGGMGKVVLGFSGYGVYLYVPKSRLEEAKTLLGPVEV